VVIERWTGPPVETHTYLVYDQAGGEGWVIDAPLDTAEPVLQRARTLGLRLTRAILTHGHFDHLLDAGRYMEAAIPISAHPLDVPLLEAPQTAMFGLPHEMPRVEIAEELTEGMRLRLGEDDWEVWHVPGHSPGHVLLYCAAQATVLGGDLLFSGGYGRVDLPGADPEQMRQSLKRLLTLPPGTRVYPGHGPDTTLEDERHWLPGLVAAPL
jgi:glyoxylase-like metal-dependent hydrolase (beta-lactamase superfamily II)